MRRMVLPDTERASTVEVPRQHQEQQQGEEVVIVVDIVEGG